MNAPAADWLTSAAPAKAVNKEYLGCAICLGTLSRPVELGCGHKFCWVCLANAPRAHACPHCRKVHILDPGMLRERRDAFRQGYRAWRMGRPHGARGEVTSIPRPTHPATRNIAPALHDERLGRHDLAGVGTGEEKDPAAIPGGVGTALAPMSVNAEDNMSIAELLSGMAPSVPPEWTEGAAAAHAQAQAQAQAARRAAQAEAEAQAEAHAQAQTEIYAEQARQLQEQAEAAARATAAAEHAARAAGVPRAAMSLSSTGWGVNRTAAAASRDGGVNKKRRRREPGEPRDETKRRATGAMHLIVCSSVVTQIEAVAEARLPELGVEQAPEGGDGVLLNFGDNPQAVKAMICSAINAILNAADKERRAPVKWDTLQRDILWKYQRRLRNGSLYLYDLTSADINGSTSVATQAIPSQNWITGDVAIRERPINRRHVYKFLRECFVDAETG